MTAFDRRANLKGRNAVVIGGGAGIGRAVVLALAEAETDIAFCDIADTVSSTVTAVEAAGRRVMGRVADATVPDQLASFYGAVAEFFGRVDIVVNVVGGTTISPFMDQSHEKCMEEIHRNFGYVIQSTRLAIPLIRNTKRGGCIINFTTIEAHRGGGGLAVYAGAKAATTNFSKALASELGPEHIRVNVIAPDTTDSQGNRNAMGRRLQEMNADVPDDWWAKAFKMYIPLETPPTADDLANAVLFLASDLAKAITGHVIHVDGGTAASLGMVRWPYDGDVTLPIPMGNTLRKLFGE